MQLLTAAASESIQLSAARLVWPVQAGEDYQTIAHVTETILMVEQVARFSGYEGLEVQTPLLEITDRQLIEIGHQMNVPWEMARTCMTRNWDSCGRCAGCIWRDKAFSEAAIEDPAAPANRPPRPETLS